MPYLFRQYVPRRAVAFGIGEGALIFAAACVGYRLVGTGGSPLMLLARGALVTLVFQLCLYYFDLYDFSHRQDLYDVAIRIAQSWGVACLLIALSYTIVPAIIISTRVLLAVFVLAGGGVLLWRFVYVLVIEYRVFAKRLLVLGSGEQAERIVRTLSQIRDSGYSVVAQVGEGTAPRLAAREATIYTDVSELAAIVREHRIQLVVVAQDERRGKTPVRELLDGKLSGWKILNGVTFYEELTGTVLVENMTPSWLIFSEGFNRNRRVSLLKRWTDIVFSLVGIVLALPVALISAVIIKLESAGPVLYRQQRVGFREKPFELIKFRSMRQDAERDGPVWATKKDPRVTRYGAFMRKTRIDELPQLWNILRRDMSFVGPRPERPEFVSRLEEKIPYYSLRHSVRPGLTGWAQIRHPYGNSDEDALRKLEFDLYYVKNMNALMDAMIVLRTIKAVLLGRGGW